MRRTLVCFLLLRLWPRPRGARTWEWRTPNVSMQLVPFWQTLKKKKERKSTRAKDRRRDEACYFQITQRTKRSLDDPCRPEKQSVRKSERAPSSVTFTLSGRIKISALAAGNLALKKWVFSTWNATGERSVTWKYMLSAENTTRTDCDPVTDETTFEGGRWAKG